MEALNTTFKEAFLRVTHMQALLQGAASNIIDVLTDRDGETAQPIFTLLLDLPAMPADA